MPITYAIQRITINAAQLANWHGSASDAALNLDGPCPECGHDSPIEISRRVTALEGLRVEPPKTLTVDLACGCREAHEGRPDGVSGCGRDWLVVTTVADDGTVSLVHVSSAASSPSPALPPASPPGSPGSPSAAPAPGPDLVAAAEALRDETAPKQLSDLRSAADKWIGGVTALFGLFGLAGVTITRNTVTGLGTSWQVGIGIAAAVAIALAGLSVYLTYRAAYGWPETYPITNDAELLRWYRARQAAPRVQAEFLKNGVRAACGALVVLVVTVGLLWFAPQQPTTGPLVKVTLNNGSQVCGTLLPPTVSGTTLIRRASDGTAIGIPLSSLADLTAVAAC